MFELLRVFYGGEEGIRTLEWFNPLHAFQAGYPRILEMIQFFRPSGRLIIALLVA